MPTVSQDIVHKDFIKVWDHKCIEEKEEVYWMVAVFGEVTVGQLLELSSIKLQGQFFDS